MSRFIVIAGGALLLVLLILAVLGVRSCAREPDAPAAAIDAARDAALVGIAAEGNAATTNAMSNAADAGNDRCGQFDDYRGAGAGDQHAYREGGG